jgi:hypothetical protein
MQHTYKWTILKKIEMDKDDYRIRLLGAKWKVRQLVFYSIDLWVVLCTFYSHNALFTTPKCEIIEACLHIFIACNAPLFLMPQSSPQTEISRENVRCNLFREICPWDTSRLWFNLKNTVRYIFYERHYKFMNLSVRY